MSKHETYESMTQNLIPGPRDEDWRYADLSLIRGSALAVATATAPGKLPAPITKWPQLVIANGKAIKVPDTLKGAEIGINRKDSSAEPVNHPLERINRSFADAGFEITISGDLAGLEVIIIEDGKTEGARHLRNRISLESGASANMLVRMVGRQKASWLNMVTTIDIGKNAEFNMASDFDAAGKTLVSNLIKTRVKKDGSIRCFGFGVGQPSLRNEVEVDLQGKNAKATIKGGMLAGVDEVIDFVTRIIHSKPGAQSSQTVRGVAGKAGQVAFQGRVVVEKDAQKTDAHQSCQNLILERTGEANVKPELLIFADDVVCSHGATVGEIDEASLYYMMQRGIPEGEAKSLLVRAFLGAATEGLVDGPLKTYFEQKINNWMHKNLVENTK